MEEKKEKYFVGQRLVLEGEKGTLRWKGKLERKEEKGEYFGVEWDLPSTKGKNDGSLEGKNYFQCKFGRASFVPLKKMEKAKLERKVGEALKGKYESEEQFFFDRQNNFVQTVKSKVQIELVVEKERKKLEELKIVSLRGCQVRDNQNANLHLILPKCSEIDLSDNLFVNLEESLSLSSLSSFETLNLSENYLTGDISSSKFSCIRLKTLVLDKTFPNFNISQLGGLEKCFPSLQEIFLRENRIETLKEINPTSFPSLKMIDLSENEFQDWKELSVLDNLESLESLRINRNKLKQINFTLQKVKSLSIDENLFENWSSLISLDEFPSLTSLRISTCPLFQSVLPQERRLLVIANFTHLEILNGSQVSVDERKNAERFYIQKVMKGTKKEEEREELEREMPKLKQLISKHGTFLPESESGEENERRGNLVEIKFENVCNESSVQTLSKQIPLSIQVSQLKFLLTKLFKLSNFESKSLYYKAKNEPVPLKLNQDEATLLSYSVSDGTIIIVDD